VYHHGGDQACIFPASPDLLTGTHGAPPNDMGHGPRQRFATTATVAGEARRSSHQTGHAQCRRPALNREKMEKWHETPLALAPSHV